MSINRSKQGFAVLDAATHLALSSKGGRTSHANGTAHKYQKGSPLAREAGRKGASVAKANRMNKSATIVDLTVEPVLPMMWA